MLFSIVIPVYNSEKYLRNCIGSCLAQTFSDFEVVVINDGSKDASKDILTEYTKKTDKIHVYHFENAGVSVSRRRGISLANGEYIIFVDSDDTISPNLLENLQTAITAFEKPDIIRYQSNLVNDFKHKDPDRYNFFENVNTPMNGMTALRTWSKSNKRYAVYWIFAFKKSVFSDVLSFPNLRCYEDVALIPILIAKSQKVVTIEYIGYNYTCDNFNSLTRKKDITAEKSRAIDFASAYVYALDNFRKINNISMFDLGFFVEDFNKRLRQKFGTLPDELKDELSNLYGM